MAATLIELGPLPAAERVTETNGRPTELGANAEKNVSCSKRYGMQCAALSYKNIILMRRNKIASLVAVLTPAVFIILLGILVIDEKATALKGKPTQPIAHPMNDRQAQH